MPAAREEQKWIDIVRRLCNVLAFDLMILAGIEQDHLLTLCVAFIFIFGRQAMYLIRYMASNKTNTYHLLERLGMKHIEVSGTFQDLGVSFLRCMLVFGAQTMLMAYYLIDLSNLGRLDSQAYRFWISSILIQFMTKDQMSQDFQVEAEFWDYCKNELNPDKMSLEKDSKSFGLPRRTELWLRFLFAKVSHSVYLQIVIYTLPLQLMGSRTGLDFVKDTFAIVFIPSLDFYSEAKTYKIVMHVRGNV